MSKFENPESFNDHQKEDEESCQTVSNDSTCITFVHQNVLVEAIVTIKPRIICGDNPTISCGPAEVRKIKKEEHHHKPKPNVKHFNPSHIKPKPGHKGHKKEHESSSDNICSFIVGQELCLTIPLVFNAEAIVKPGKIACKDVEKCSCSCESENEAES